MGSSSPTRDQTKAPPVLRAPSLSHCTTREVTTLCLLSKFKLFFFLKNFQCKLINRSFLVVQWLRLHAPNAVSPGWIPGQGTRSHMPQLKILCEATKTQHSQIKKNKNKWITFSFFKFYPTPELYSMFCLLFFYIHPKPTSFHLKG